MCYLGFPANAEAPPARPTEVQADAVKQRPPAPYSDDFMVYAFKVVECDNPEHTRDDWDACPFAHAGEVVTRRPPHTHLPKLCPKARRACRKGRACPYAHNVFEHWLHPSRFKTEICQHGSACMRPMCFFAHYPEEVRHPSPSADEVMAAAEAAGLLGRPHAAHNAHAGPGCGYAAPPPRAASYGGYGPGAAWACAAPAADMRAQARLFTQYNADLAFAAQCLRAQQQAQAEAQLRQAQAQAAAAAAAAAVTSGWAGSDWSVLSSGGASPELLPTSGDSSPSSALMGPPFASAPLMPAPAPLPLPLRAGGGGAAFDLWGPAPAPQPAYAPAMRGPPGLSNNDALYLLAGLSASNTSAASRLLCALQAGQAGAANAAAAAAAAAAAFY